MLDPLLARPTRPTFYFIGVTTASSSSRQMFPLWMQALEHPEVQLHGIDMKIHDKLDNYRQVVAHIKREPLALGALVTTHKIDLLDAARDLFDELGPYAQLTNEVSSIAKDAGKLIGRATDPVAGGLSLDAILGQDYFAGGSKQVLLLGAGGSATALCLHLLNKKRQADRPRRIVVVNRSAGRLERLRHMVARFKTDIQLDYIHNNDPQRNDALLADLPAGSVVVNATGMGKDTPGSPVSGTVPFPRNGIVWELNYRGELDFLQQARAQQAAQHLTVVDGWDYFVHGWSQVIGHVLQITIKPAMFTQLSQLAAVVR